MTLHAVYDAAQKNSDYSHQPICRLFGTTIFILSMEVYASVLGVADGCAPYLRAA